MQFKPILFKGQLYCVNHHNLRKFEKWAHLLWICPSNSWASELDTFGWPNQITCWDQLQAELEGETRVWESGQSERKKARDTCPGSPGQVRRSPDNRCHSTHRLLPLSPQNKYRAVYHNDDGCLINARHYAGHFGPINFTLSVYLSLLKLYCLRWFCSYLKSDQKCKVENETPRPLPEAKLIASQHNFRPKF